MAILSVVSHLQPSCLWKLMPTSNSGLRSRLGCYNEPWVHIEQALISRWSHICLMGHRLDLLKWATIAFLDCLPWSGARYMKPCRYADIIVMLYVSGSRIWVSRRPFIRRGSPPQAEEDILPATPVINDMGETHWAVNLDPLIIV